MSADILQGTRFFVDQTKSHPILNAQKLILGTSPFDSLRRNIPVFQNLADTGLLAILCSYRDAAC
jgi:hypothetical protein